MSAQRAIHVHMLIDTLAVGGAEILLAELASVARDGGMELSIGYLQNRRGDQVVARLRAAGVQPTCVGIPGRLGAQAFLRVRRHLAEVRPALVHTHLGYADLLGGLAARSLGLPTVATLHSHAPPSTARERMRLRMTVAARRACAARVIAVSDSARAAYVAAGGDRPDRLVVVRNGVGGWPQRGAGRAVRAELGLAPEHVVVGLVSSLRPEKAHDVALAAMHALAPRFPQLRLLVAGDGPLRSRIERGAAELGDRVVLAGYRADVMAVLDAVDVLLHPSRADTLPTAVIEAMACSVPVVATDVGGVGELVVDGVTGTLVAAPPQASVLESALAPLVLDRELRARMGAAGRARFEADFSATRWARHLREVYLSVLEGAA